MNASRRCISFLETKHQADVEAKEISCICLLSVYCNYHLSSDSQIAKYGGSREMI
uniref:Uncharacterized protein n=1 Tax=Arundo donax TaxID=35708 RepID=A0A0A9G309_ARUDO